MYIEDLSGICRINEEGQYFRENSQVSYRERYICVSNVILINLQIRSISTFNVSRNFFEGRKFKVGPEVSIVNIILDLIAVIAFLSRFFKDI